MVRARGDMKSTAHAVAKGSLLIVVNVDHTSHTVADIVVMTFLVNDGTSARFAFYGDNFNRFLELL